MAKIPQRLHALIDGALADGAPCLIGTASRDGWPQISPKGSVLVLDDETLAYWERVRRTAQANVSENARVVVWYRNPAKADQLPRGAALRFYGTASTHESGALADQVWAKCVPAERDRDPERKGLAVVVKVERLEDLAGNAIT
jgi:hypothetical protein